MDVVESSLMKEYVILSLIQNSFIYNTVLCCLVCLYSSLGVPDRVKGGVYQVAFDLSETATYQFLPKFPWRFSSSSSRLRLWSRQSYPPSDLQVDQRKTRTPPRPSTRRTKQLRSAAVHVQSRPKYHERDIRTQMSMLYNFLTRGFDAEDVQDTDIKQHSTGSVRTLSFCKIGPREKAKYLHLCGTAAENHIKNIETAKAVTKMQGLPREAQSN
ncbi:hypothetical protein quinque_002317 [Culex quinquefasciatus]